MKELIDALADCKRNSSRLVDIIADAMQDGQFSSASRSVCTVLLKYKDKYGHLTVAEIRALSLET